MKKELFDEVYIEKEGVPYKIKLTYYLLTDHLNEEYCDLIVYGVEIDKEETKKSGSGLKEKKIVDDLFFRRDEAINFLRIIRDRKVTPIQLRYVVNDYIGERI